MLPSAESGQKAPSTAIDNDKTIDAVTHLRNQLHELQRLQQIEFL